MSADNATLLDSLFFAPLCDGWSNNTEGAIYHLGNTFLFLGYMGGSGAYGCLFIFGFLTPAFLCLTLWGWLTMCGLDVFGWNLLLLLASLAQVCHLLVRLHQEGVRGEELSGLYHAVYLPLGVPVHVFKEITGAFENKVVELKAGETYAVEGKTPIDQLSFLLSGRWGFIDGRLAKLNAGRGFSDVFEEEITEGGFCGSNSRSYQQWMHTVKRGGAFINTAVTKAKSHAKRGIRDIKGRLKAREEEEEGITVCAGSPTSTKSLSPRRLQKMRRQNFNKSPISVGPRDLGYGFDDDDLDRASKISSEDSGDVASYIEDSDDSYSLDLDMNSSRSGQMNLLEEILDSLNTTTVDQGKLSAAKSLDFFRSMEELDYKAPKKSSSSESQPAEERGCGGVGDQAGWNMGQDDSAVHGKHLPPSPRRNPNKISMNASKKMDPAPAVPIVRAVPFAHDADTSKLRPHETNSDRYALPPARQPADRYSYAPSTAHRVTPAPPSPTSSHNHGSPANHSPLPAGRSRATSDPQACTADPPQPQNQTASTSILRRKVLSKETVRQYQEKALLKQANKDQEESQGCLSRSSQSAMQVPWEKEVSKEGLLGFGLCLGQGKDSGAAMVQDQGLLEEIESMCCLGSVLHSSLQLSQVHCNNSPHQVQGKASEEL